MLRKLGTSPLHNYLIFWGTLCITFLYGLFGMVTDRPISFEIKNISNDSLYTFIFHSYFLYKMKFTAIILRKETTF